MAVSPSPTPLTRDRVRAVLQQHRGRLQAYAIASLALFGSTARNEAAADSDLDFLVEFSVEPTFALYTGLKIYLEDLFGKSVDLVVKTDLKPQIRDAVLREAVRVA